MPRWTRDRTLAAAARGRPYITQQGTRVDPILLWANLVEWTSRKGLPASILWRAIGCPASATPQERWRCLRVLDGNDVVRLTDEIVAHWYRHSSTQDCRNAA